MVYNVHHTQKTATKFAPNKTSDTFYSLCQPGGVFHQIQCTDKARLRNCMSRTLLNIATGMTMFRGTALTQDSIADTVEHITSLTCQKF